MKNKTTILTLGSCLSALYSLAHPCYKNQVDFFNALLSTFHQTMSDRQNYKFELCQSRASQILRSRELLPRDASILYMGQNGDEMLKKDMEAYLSITAVSHKQKRLYEQTLLDLVNNSDNLDPQDKAYILDYVTTENDNRLLSELLFRMLHILIREPLQESA